MSKIDFTGRVAIITGAGAGLGKDYAIELAKRGAEVVVNDLGGARDGTGTSHAAANKVVEEIKAFGGKAVPNYDTVATVKGGENIVKTAIDIFGKVDILINNAGILRDKTFVNMEEESWDALMDVHLKGAYCVSRPAFIRMREWIWQDSDDVFWCGYLWEFWPDELQRCQDGHCRVDQCPEIGGCKIQYQGECPASKCNDKTQ